MGNVRLAGNTLGGNRVIHAGHQALAFFNGKVAIDTRKD
jgi:hypothetical protein